MTAPNLFLGAALISLIGAGVFEARILSHQRDELQALQKNARAESRLAAALRRDHDKTQGDILAAEQELAALPALDTTTAARQTELKAWLARLKQLRQLVAERPEQRIPELQLLAYDDWLPVAQHAAFDDEHDRRKVFGELRTRAKSKFFKRVTEALGNYIKAGGDDPPSSILALATHFNQPIDLEILERYEIFKGTLSSDPSQAVGLIVRERAAVDEDYDTRNQVSSNAGEGWGPPFAWPADFQKRIGRAYYRYTEANHGVRPASMTQALPYFDPPVDPSKAEAAVRIERAREK